MNASQSFKNLFTAGLAFSRAGWRVYFCSAVVMVGMTSSLGFFLRSPALKRVGYASAASPAPFVFNQFRGLEYWASEVQIQLSMKDGSTRSIDADHRFYSVVGDNHTLRMAYIIPTVLSPRLAPAFGCSAMVYGFCRSKTLGRRFGVGGEVQEIHLLFRFTGAKEEQVWTKKCQCE